MFCTKWKGITRFCIMSSLLLLNFLSDSTISSAVSSGSRAFIPFLSTDVSIPNGSGVWSLGKWPKAYTPFHVFITQPLNFTQKMIHEVKDKTGALLLLYWDSQHTPALAIGCSTGDVEGDAPGKLVPHSNQGEYAYKMRSMGFSPEYAVRPIPLNYSNPIVCRYPGLASYVLMKKSADVIVDFIADWAEKYGFDGFYLDNQFSSASFAQYNPTGGGSIDVNGDGIADSIEDIVTQYTNWRPYYTQKLRKRLPNAIIMGNSGGPLSDPAMNGLSLEMEYCEDVQRCIDIFEAQAAVGVSPPLSILWLTHSNIIPPQQQCATAKIIQDKLPWIVIGTDFFDGSHVVCNTSASL